VSARAERRGLELVSVGGAGEGLLDRLGRELDRIFGTRSFRGPPLPLLDGWRDPETGQLRSGDVVDALIARSDALAADGSRLWSLAVAGEDLGAPGRTWVFGEATVGGCCAVVSLARLSGPGEDARSPRLRTRLLAEATHELGHVAGLEHCDRAECVMAPTTSVEEVDRRGAEPCARCMSLLHAAVRTRSA
jgi:archaemetzincin